MNLLKTIFLSELINWSVQYLLKNNFSYNQKFTLVRISDFLTRNKTSVIVEDDKEYKRIIIKINNGGVFLRDIESGEKIGTKKQFLVKEGQFLLSKIDARNGAFGVVPNEVNGAIITGNFWTYDVKKDLINPHFLALMVTTPEFISFSENASNGTTNRHYLQEKLFLAQKIPLPSLKEQNKIVTQYNKKIALAESQKNKKVQLEKDVENYLFNILGIKKLKKKEKKKGLTVISYNRLTKWASSHYLKNSIFNINSGNFKTLQIRELIDFFKGGKTPSKQNNNYWTGNISWTSPKDFSNLFIEKSKDHISEQAVNEASMEIFPKGTILSVFRSGILRHSFPTAITTIETTINQDLKAYKLKEDVINNFYYLYFIEVFKEYILINASKKSVTVESINSEEFMELDIPIPPLEIQNKIVSKIDDLKRKIKTLEEQAKQNYNNATKEFEQKIFKPA